ncbi:MAG: NAD(P)/FAD-dependent oxidoreductase [Ruminococcaceae bacterium]|nr:NAD(P)/FAD-dependent oxidoreductase [Oscillospiraceae bacterium]
MFDVAIIGAGVVGGMIARELSRYQLSVCILDKENDVSMGASRANSAIVHAGFDAKEGSLKARFNVKGATMMPTVCEELGVPYINNGSLVIGFNDEDRKNLNTLLKRGKANGVKELRIVEREELKKMEPNVSNDAICALYAPTGAITCPYELTVAAIGNAMDNGAKLYLNFEVSEIRKTDFGFKIFSKDNAIESRFVVNAAGVYADNIAGMVGDSSFAIHPRRGEYILLDKECGSIVSHTIFRTPSQKGKGILVSPTVDGNLLTGPTAEDIEDKEDRQVTSSGYNSVLRQAQEDVQGIVFQRTITSFCGLRAVGNTGDFIINVPVSGFVNVAGIESPGLSASPAIAEYVAELLQNEGLTLKENHDFNPVRKPFNAFRRASLEEKNAMIQKDKAYGKIVCRCERVTEGEILEALRTNPKARDLDGVKRRTRAQMGRCQGGFCMPYIAEMIAKEQGIPFEQVTKRGGRSYVTVGKTKEDAE